MRNLTLHELLEAFTVEAGLTLDRALADGEEIPFEVVASEVRHEARRDARREARNQLYCYRPLTDAFVAAHLGALLELPSCAPAVQALESSEGLESYLRARGERHLSDDHAQLTVTALELFLMSVFRDRSEFTFDDARFTVAYDELERALYRERCVTEVVARLRGVDLDPATSELKLGEGLAICRPAALAGAPDELLEGTQAPLLLVLRIAHDRAKQPSIAFARAHFATVLTALRLFDRGEPALDPIGAARTDAGAWSPARLGFGGRSRRLMLIARDSEQELHDFRGLIARRLPRSGEEGAGGRPGSGELAWALARFEMGCERQAPLESLTDHLLALRALLEPEGTASGRLAQRLSVICATPEQRAGLAERTAQAIALERAVIAGLASASAQAEALAYEVAENLRAILRDMLCGHLDADVRAVADELLAEAVDEQPLAA